MNAKNTKNRRIPIACDRCRSLRRACQPPFPCSRCAKANVPCQSREKARPSCARSGHTPQSLSPSLTSYAPPRAVDASLAGEDSGRQKPVKISTFTSYSHIPEDLSSLIVRPAKIKHGLDISLNFSEPSPANARFPTACESATDGQHCASQTFSNAELTDLLEEFFSRDFILSCIIDKAVILDLVHDFFRHEASFTFQTQAALRMTSITADTAAALFAILALLMATKPLCRCIPEWLFDQSTNAVNDFTGPASSLLVAALFIQHIYAIGNKTTNQAKAVLGQAVLLVRDLDLEQASEPTGDSHARWLYLSILFADQYTSTQHITSKPMISLAEIDHPILNALLTEEPGVRRFIRLLLLQKEISDELSRHQIDEEMLVRIEAKMSAAMEATVSEPECDAVDRAIAVNETLSRIHVCWARIVIRSPFLTGPRSMESTSICLRASQTILSCYQNLLQPTRNLRSLAPTWRQAMRLVSCSCILLLGLWREEITEGEAQRDLNVVVWMLRGFRRRWDPAAGDMLRLLEGLMGVSGLEVDLDRQNDTVDLPVESTSMVAGQCGRSDASTSLQLPQNHDVCDNLDILQDDLGLLDPLWLMPDGWEFDGGRASNFIPFDDVNNFTTIQ
ncbi:hypothetical protein DL98DRAFT_566859 [Cadophora sp. DSE1049]|nr:hypothetical protein DL98DRAFT_566859 [Cadophora sp. DSE1049]